MRNDPIVEEIRERRKKHAAKFGNNISEIVKALQKDEKKGGRKIVSFAKAQQNKKKVSPSMQPNSPQA